MGEGLLGGSAVKNHLLTQETWVQSLGWADPLRRVWQHTPRFLPGESHGQRNLVGYTLWGHKESNSTEQLNNKKWIMTVDIY